jgi:hypothetical protein
LNRNLMLYAALLIALVALGGNFFVMYQDSGNINQNKTSLTNQIAALQSSVSGLQGTVNSLKTQLSQSQSTSTSQAQQLAAAQSSLRGLQTQLANLLSDLNSNTTNNLAFQDVTLSQLRSINSSLATITQRLDAISSSAPLTTLVIVAETYDNASATFNFTVRNNLNVTVHAQLSALLYGQGSYPCDGNAGSYTSQVYAFPSNSTTLTQLVLSQGDFDGCGTSPIDNVWLEFLATSQSVQVSEAYTFVVIPPYNFVPSPST